MCVNDLWYEYIKICSCARGLGVRGKIRCNPARINLSWRRGEMLVSRLGRILRGKRASDSRLAEPQNQYGYFGDEENFWY
jgi:hypothetical protein